uniref:LSM domain-containing protein n=1 Tax=Trypanosoma congolense (strain IL3000) TaxID=1068625 RepID=G0USB5_TRYCI|nr:conserved hypothetical protein [Trypanosoma congolense IL3000]
MDAAASSTIPSAMGASGCLQHALVRVVMTNGMLLTGRIVEFDAVTMNMKLDAITDTAIVHSGADGNHKVPIYEANPAALLCCSSAVVRGCHVRYLDFIDEEVDGGRGLQELVAAVSAVRPSVAQQ